MSAPSSEFWLIPTEIAEQVLSLCHPRDVASFSQTCRTAWSLANGSTDQHLWRQLFLSFPFDDPRRGPGDIQFDWKTELQRRVHAEIMARSAQSAPEDLHAALATILGVVRSASPVLPGYERAPSANLRWAMDILISTNMLQSPSFTHQYTSQALTCLRSYLALTLDKHDDDEGRLRMKSIRARSRRQVYDLHNYTRENDWGPFLSDTGDVNWFHVECIVNVMVLNFADNLNRLRDPKPPRGLEATRAYSAPNVTKLPSHDWAGVEGNWCRMVSLMDHRDLFAFNFFVRGHTSNSPAWFFEDLHFSEVILSTELELHLITPNELPNYYNLNLFHSSEDTNYPTLYFSGSFRGVHTHGPVVIGSVHMTDNGVVRWRFISAHGGRAKWSSEGIQIGGIASAMGVVGTWTGARHERGDPTGPFWLWKVSAKQS